MTLEHVQTQVFFAATREGRVVVGAVFGVGDFDELGHRGIFHAFNVGEKGAGVKGYFKKVCFVCKYLIINGLRAPAAAAHNSLSWNGLG